MPPVSQAQRRLFRWAAENPRQAAARGISRAVAREFNASDPGGKLPDRKPKSREERKAARYGGPRS